LRHIAWICTRNNDYQNSQICVVVGPNQDLAIKLIRRLKALFEPKLNIVFSSKETALTLNGCAIEAYPSNHLSAMRSLTNPKLIFIDECAFFHQQEMNEVRQVAERYIAKSSPVIILVSTPNKPGDLMHQIAQEDESTCIYKRLYLDYTYGLGYIYSQQEIDNAKKSGSFAREYDLRFAGIEGTLFHQQDIDRAVERGKLYNPDSFNTLARFTSTSLGIDPAYGSSNFGLCVTTWQNDHIEILYAQEFSRPDFNEMLQRVYDLMSKYDVSKTYIDGSAVAFIRSLKLMIGEDSDYLEQIARLKSSGLTEEHALRQMKIIPVNFNKESKNMLGHCKLILENDYIAINPTFDKLITSLRSAVDEDGVLNKDQTVFNDVFDSLRLALKFYKFDEA
jgi:terminase large subunit-like protein